MLRESSGYRVTRSSSPVARRRG